MKSEEFDGFKKYEFSGETIYCYGKTLHRIKALRPFCDVKKGDLGGFIESEKNLSHSGSCWVYGDAKVFDNASVSHSATVSDKAMVCGNAQVYDYAKVFGSASVDDDARVYDFASVSGIAEVGGDAYIYDSAQVTGYAKVCGCAQVRDSAFVGGNAVVFECAVISDNAAVFGNASVCGSAHIRGAAKIARNQDYIVFKNFWSSGRYFTWTRSDNMWCAGCFRGTGEELIKKAYADNEESGREYARVVRYVNEIRTEDNEKRGEE